MRFDGYAQTHNVVIKPVDHFDGLEVEVGLPPEWEPFDTSLGFQVWIWRGDPHIAEFGANAVLTMHTVEKPLDSTEVFAMLCEQQKLMVPGAQELERESATASDGPGIAGSLAMNIASQFGAIGSMSLSRIITTERQTLIGQLTITALRESPVKWENIWFYVKKNPEIKPLFARNLGGVPLSAPHGGSHG